MEKLNFYRKNVAIAMSSFLLLFASQVLAAGGLDKVNTFMDNILSLLRGVSIAVVTIAIIWAGYKFIYQHAGVRECMTIIGGGVLIGAASEIAQYLLG